MIKSIFKKKLLSSRYFFCMNNNNFPDEILESVRNNIRRNSFEEIQAELEVEIINNIHFFDCDQFTDLFILFAENDKGTTKLWDLLSRKIYDFDFNDIQRLHLIYAINNTYKYDQCIKTHLIFPFYKKAAKGENKLNLYEQVLF